MSSSERSRGYSGCATRCPSGVSRCTMAGSGCTAWTCSDKAAPCVERQRGRRRARLSLRESDWYRGGAPPELPRGSYHIRDSDHSPVHTVRMTQGVAPPSHVGWAITAVVFFWPLAIPAFIYSLRVTPAWA